MFGRESELGEGIGNTKATHLIKIIFSFNSITVPVLRPGQSSTGSAGDFSEQRGQRPAPPEQSKRSFYARAASKAAE